MRVETAPKAIVIGALVVVELLQLGWAMWVWIAILLVILALSMFTVTPPSPEQTGEPPP